MPQKNRCPPAAQQAELPARTEAAPDEFKTDDSWDAAMAITFLRDGIVSSTKEISWRHLPDASGEIQVLNAAIQTDKIDVIELLLNGALRRLIPEDKARTKLRFREIPVVDGIGVELEVLDTETGECRPRVTNLVFRPEEIRALRKSRHWRSKYKQAHVIRVLNQLWPQGIPSKDVLPNRDFVALAAKAFKKDPTIQELGLPTPSPKTFLRAAKRILDQN